VITVYIDGGSRGNPGPAGYGVRIENSEGAVLDRFNGSLGIATNNIAEYKGLLAALEWAAQRGHKQVHVRSDSELLVRQMKGEYKVRNVGLQPLHTEARALMGRIGHVTFEHVRRELNRDADRLANEAMDAADVRAQLSGRLRGDASSPE
jgi:ribonuclease HI